jgi:hypothetical protein
MLCQAGKLRPDELVAGTVPLAQAGQALARMEGRQVLGKLVLLPHAEAAARL